MPIYRVDFYQVTNCNMLVEANNETEAVNQLRIGNYRDEDVAQGHTCIEYDDVDAQLYE